MCVCCGPAVPVTGTTATWPSRVFNALTLMTTAGCSPKSSKSTSHTSPRKGSGSDIGPVGHLRPDTDRQRYVTVAVEIVNAARHPFFGRAPVEQFECCLHDLGPAIQAEQFGVLTQLRGQLVGDSCLPRLGPCCRHRHVYKLPTMLRCRADHDRGNTVGDGL